MMMIKTNLVRHITNVMLLKNLSFTLYKVHQKQRTACPVCGKRYSDLRQHIRLVHEGRKVDIVP